MAMIEREPLVLSHFTIAVANVLIQLTWRRFAEFQAGCGVQEQWPRGWRAAVMFGFDV
jgi:hypothetical protein